MSVIEVAVILDLVTLPVWTGRVVHQHHVVVLQVDVQVLLVEALWSVLLWLLAVLAVGVLRCPCELCRWHAVYLCKHLVYNLQLLLLHLKELLLLCAVLVCGTQLKTELAQLCCEQCRECASVVACVALLHHALGYDTVLCNVVGHAGECTAIAEWVVEQPVDSAVIVWLLACVDYALEEQVRFLQLVIEEVVYL